MWAAFHGAKPFPGIYFLILVAKLIFPSITTVREYLCRQGVILLFTVTLHSIKGNNNNYYSLAVGGAGVVIGNPIIYGKIIIIQPVTNPAPFWGKWKLSSARFVYIFMAIIKYHTTSLSSKKLMNFFKYSQKHTVSKFKRFKLIIFVSHDSSFNKLSLITSW